MNPIIRTSLLTLCVFFLPFLASAHTDEFKDMVQSVREKLVILLTTKDPQKQGERVQQIYHLSQDIDQFLQTRLANKEISEDERQRLQAFKSLWLDFKSTRDREIIPAVLNGNPEKLAEAKKLARTIQAERFQKMQALVK